MVAGPYSQPFGALCLQVLGRNSGLALFALNMIAQFFCAQACTITASRVVFAYSRDGAILGSRYWAKVDKRTHTPVYATCMVLTVSALLGALLFAGPIVIGAVFSIGAIGQYTAFVVSDYPVFTITSSDSIQAPIALKLFFNKGRFRPGPWNLGRWSKPTNAAACAWWLVIAPALCFPAVTGADLTAKTMNWTILIYGGPMFAAVCWYGISARHWFAGPRINVEHRDQTGAPSLETADSQGSHDRHVQKEL